MKHLKVLHIRKTANGGASAIGLPTLSQRPFVVDTCQRLLWLAVDETWEPPSGLPHGVEFRQGVEAYALLLRIGCGLESAVRGETEVFGQLKQGWQEFRKSEPAGGALEQVMQRTFEDIKEIRAQFLQSCGNASYGSLVRKILKAHAASPDDTVLLAGAGALACSVAPWLSEYPVIVLNRTREAAQRLVSKLVRGRVAENADEAWEAARHAVLCVPSDLARDLPRIEAIRARLPQAVVIHLGSRGKEIPSCHDLDDLFAAQREAGDAQEVNLREAAKACDDRARLRGLGGSLSIPHGWEDLAVFSCP